MHTIYLKTTTLHGLSADQGRGEHRQGTGGAGGGGGGGDEADYHV
jgi:hypothetical protein